MVVVDSKGFIALANTQARTLLGYACDELSGARIERLVPESQRRSGGELVARQKDGSELPVDVILSPLTFEGAAFTIVTLRDGSTRTRAETQREQLIREQAARREAERSAERAKLLADASKLLGSSRDYERTLGELPSVLVPAFTDWVVIHLARRDGQVHRIKIRYADPERQQLADELERVAPRMEWSGPSHAAIPLLGEGRSLVVPDLDTAVLAAMITDPAYRRLVTDRLQPRSMMLVPLVAREVTIGAIMLVSTRADRRYTDADLPLAEDLASRIALAVDAARLFRMAERAEADARAANDAKDVFLAMLAHELRNPLGAIVSAVSVLHKTGAQDATATRARDIIKRQASHLAHMVDDLLDLTRVMTGKAALAPQKLDVAETAVHAVAALRAAGALDHHRTELSVNPVWVSADRTRLHQVITNLLTNAIKYTPEDGLIRVHVGPDERDAVLRVTDTGIGIAAELLPRVFDLFTQGERPLDRRQGGLGIGLTLVKRLVEQHGGGVEARSAGPGTGAEFLVRLPRVEPPSVRSPAPSTDGTAARRRILIVEDNDDVRDMLRTALSIVGHDVHEAADGERGLEAALRLRPDVALIDLGLPGLDGYEVARRLRAAGHRDRLVAVTGYGQAEDRRRSADAGFDAHLVKPVDDAELARIVQE